jgi:hypothetical protein
MKDRSKLEKQYLKTMTPLFFQDEVFLDCSKDLDTSACTFTFRGKEIYLQHTLEIKPKQSVHRMVCKVDGETYNFGVGHSTHGTGAFGTWPVIEIDGDEYHFRIDWPLTEGSKAIRLDTRGPDEEIDAPSGRRKNMQLMNEIRNEFKDLNQLITEQEERDDVEGFLHIHTLPPEARKRVIEHYKKNKK